MYRKDHKSIYRYFEVLGIQQGATITEIKAAFKTQIKKWHPDKFPHLDESYVIATERSKLIIEAYEVLKSYNVTPQINNPTQQQQNNDSNKRTDIFRTRVRSSNIYSAGYDVKTATLQIEFHNGRVYEYFGVPLFIFDEFMAASSKGKFANRNIFNNYSYRAV